MPKHFLVAIYSGYLIVEIIDFNFKKMKKFYRLQVLNVELNAIKRACLKINPDYKPAITFLVVQKRHHTRFFPEPKDGDRKNQNVPAGTLVDRKITHPTEVDFYLVSHQSIQVCTF